MGESYLHGGKPNVMIFEEGNNENDFQLGISMISFYKRLAELIEIQLSSKDSPLRGILKYFKKDFQRRYVLVPQRYYLKQISREQAEQERKKLVEEVGVFMRVFLDTLIVYYQLDEISAIIEGGLLTRDNLWNFLITILFDDSIFSTVYEIYKIVDEKDAEIFGANLRKLTRKEPQTFEVRPQFCLNHLTIDYLNEKFSNSKDGPLFEYEDLSEENKEQEDDNTNNNQENSFN